jgi:hypothetical protein
MTEARWAPILPQLKEFQLHLAPHVPAFRIEHLNDRRWSYARYREQCKTGAYNRYGVYLIFDPAEKLEYVGVAMNSFHDRIWDHDSFLERMLTDVIAIPHEYYFLGLALEFFLICRLHPPKNTVYRGYTIPECPCGVQAIRPPG